MEQAAQVQGLTKTIEGIGEAIDLNWTTSQSAMGTACSSPNKTGWYEAKIRGVMKATNDLQWTNFRKNNLFIC